MSRKPKPRLLEIKWLDHFSRDDSWTEPADYKVVPHIVTSAGIFVHETADYITIATNRGYDGQFSCFMSILKKVITEKRVLK